MNFFKKENKNKQLLRMYSSFYVEALQYNWPYKLLARLKVKLNAKKGVKSVIHDLRLTDNRFWLLRKGTLT